MDRRTFLGVSASALLATELKGMDIGFRDSESQGIVVRFLGTGAADWNGKDERGEMRRFSSVLVDRRVLVDFTPSAEDMLPENCRPEEIFYTHSHGDHYNPSAAIKLGVKKVYLGKTWAEEARNEFASASKELNLPFPEIVPLEIGDRITTGNLTFTALPANHATGRVQELSLIYLIEKENVRLLYATDTGGLTSVAARLAGIDAHIRDGKPITGLVMEATMGIGYEDDFRIFGHSSVATVAQTVRVLTQTKRYLPPAGQPVYLTHLARTLHGTQADLDAGLPAPLRAAYDGLETIFE